jgi:hypothetical protein
VHRRDLRRDPDLSGELPGIIAGRVSAKGMPTLRGRLVVLAIREDAAHADWSSYQELVRRRRWTLAADDGTFELALVPGEHRIQVVDCATGVVLHEHKETVAVECERTTRVELACALVELHVTLESKQGRPVTAHYLEIRGALDPGDAWPRDLVVFGAGVEPSIDLSGSEDVPVFFVPPGKVRLRVPYGAKRISARSVTLSGNEDQRALEEIEARAGKRQEVTLIVGPPRDLRPAGR